MMVPMPRIFGFSEKSVAPFFIKIYKRSKFRIFIYPYHSLRLYLLDSVDYSISHKSSLHYRILIKMAAKCKICKKSVYPMDPQINLDGSLFHKPCAKCSDCKSQITLSNFVKHDAGDETTLLCKTHYFKRFHEGGTYLGAEKYQNKAPRDLLAVDKPINVEKPTVSANSIPATLDTEFKSDSPDKLTVREITRRLSVSKDSTPQQATSPKPMVNLEA